MEISEFTFKLLVLGIPGIISYFLYCQVVRVRDKSSVMVFLTVFIFGALSYLIYSVYYGYWQWSIGHQFSLDPIEELLNQSTTVNGSSVLGASLVSVYIVLVLSYAHKKKLFNRIAHGIRATTRYGDSDVWEYFHNSPLEERNSGWIYVRDHKEKLLYYGYISAWSESEDTRELLLAQVDVYDSNTADYKYTIDQLYLARNPEDLDIEVNPTKTSESKEENAKAESTEPVTSA